MSVPVFYLTDRNKEGDTYGPDRKYLTDCKHDPFYGVAHVCIANENNKPVDEKRTNCGWQAESKKFTVSKKDEIAAGDAVATTRKFFEQLKDALTKTGKNSLYLIVLGTNESFEESVLDAATLAYHAEKPVIVYSWPSGAKYLKYRLDESNIEYSQAHFDTFLEQLNRFHSQFPIQTTIVAHSMGNRLVMRAAPFIVMARSAIKEIDLSSPDVDTETFKHYVQEYHDPNGNPNGFKVRLYVSYRDKMLSLSQRLHGGYYRLGEGTESIGKIPNKDAEDKLKTAMVANAMDVAEPLERRRVITGQIRKRLQTIDFTAVDSGLFGHQLPFELIVNMNETDNPGAGLALVHEANPEPKRLSKLRKIAKGFSSDSVGPVGSCDKVVYLEAENK